MKIGVPKEIKPQESRIGLTPESVKTLISEGQDASTIRVSIDTTGPSMNPLDMTIPGQTCPE